MLEAWKFWYMFYRRKVKNCTTSNYFWAWQNKNVKAKHCRAWSLSRKNWCIVRLRLYFYSVSTQDRITLSWLWSHAVSKIIRNTDFQVKLQMRLFHTCMAQRGGTWQQKKIFMRSVTGVFASSNWSASACKCKVYSDLPFT